MLSQSAIRSVWAPPCRGPWTTVRLHGAGKVTVRPAIYQATQALNSCLRQYGYLTRYADTGGYVCRRTTNSSSYSTHAYGIAIDINWQSNPYGSRLRTNMPRAMVNAICAIRTNNGKQVWNWGGFWTGNKDAMHYEIVCSPGDIATGINPRTVPGGSAPAPVQTDWNAVRRWNAGLVYNDFIKIPNLDGTSPNSMNIGVLQNALNIVHNAGLKVDGNYGPATMQAVYKWQQAINTLRPGSIKDFPGAAHDATRWWLGVGLANIRDGKG